MMSYLMPTTNNPNIVSILPIAVAMVEIVMLVMEDGEDKTSPTATVDMDLQDPIPLMLLTQLCV
jgi:hypothetical protein